MSDLLQAPACDICKQEHLAYQRCEPLETFEYQLEGGDVVTLSARGWKPGAHRAADLYQKPVVAWRRPPIGIHVGIPEGA